MQIPYEVSARPDTGLYNAKLGIWLFLASEVMLFAGLFSAYVFLRLGSDPGYWPHGLLSVPLGVANTFILITSSITVVLAWVALKMRQYQRYWFCMLATIVLGFIFLCIKLGVEWPAKWHHFGVYIKKEAVEKYEDVLGNDFLTAQGRDARYEVAGHLVEVKITRNGQEETINVEENHHQGHPYGTPYQIDGLLHQEGVKLVEYKLKLDEVNANPTAESNLKSHFFQQEVSEKERVIHAEDIESASAFFPRHNSYFSCYYLITGLHGLHIIGGLIVFSQMFLFGRKLYLRNPEHLANRIECVGLYWHFVDLVWIFVFPVFYLL